MQTPRGREAHRMSITEHSGPQPVRDCVADRLMFAGIAQRLLGPRRSIAPTIGRFVVLDEIGAGGMGQVYRAYDPELGRKIALKVLRPQASSDVDRGSARLHSEAMALARLSHPNVVTIFEVGVAAGEVFLVMELVEGQDLRSWNAENPAPNPLRIDARMETALTMLQQAGRGLAAAHAADLTHRDFKPANVLVGSDGRARVADFGVARAARSPDPARSITQSGPVEDYPITQTGDVLGTPRYMAPEQAANGAVADARSDQFAFCTAAWEVLFGVHPRVGDPPNSKPPGAPEGAPPRLAAALRRGLDPDPAARFPSMDGLLTELTVPRPTGTRGWRVLAAASLLAFGVGVGWSTLSDTETCSDAEPRLASVFGPEQAVMLSERGSQAARASADAFRSSWGLAYAEACEQRAAHELSDAAFDTRIACLNGVLHRFRAWLETPKHSSGTIRRGPELARVLEDTLRCSGAKHSRPPSSSFQAALEASIDTARRLGDWQGVQTGAEKLSSLAPDHSDETWIRAQRWLGTAHYERGHPGQARQYLEASYFGAADRELPGAQFEAALMLAEVEGSAMHRVELAQRWIRHAQVALRSTDSSSAARSRLLLAQARVRLLAGDEHEAGSLLDVANALVNMQDDPYERIQRLMTMADVETRIGRFEASASHTQQAEQLLAEYLGDGHTTLRARLHLVQTQRLQLQGEYESAIHRATMGLEVLGSSPSLSQARLLKARGLALCDFGDCAGAFGDYEQAVTILSELGGGPNDVFLAGLQANIGSAHWEMWAFGAAAQAYEDALSLQRRYLGTTHPATLQSAAGLAACKSRMGEDDAAIALLTEGLAASRKHYGDEHLLTADHHHHLARAYYGQGSFERAHEHAFAAIVAFTTSGNTTHPNLAEAYWTAAEIELRLHDSDAAWKFAQLGHEMAKQTSPGHEIVYEIQFAMAKAAQARGKELVAEELAADTLRGLKGMPGSPRLTQIAIVEYWLMEHVMHTATFMLLDDAYPAPRPARDSGHIHSRDSPEVD
ncbi:MAG: protein kinase [Nannocystaceae bacterium]|nr:protein kinase [Nannocystaceae bacterium]